MKSFLIFYLVVCLSQVTYSQKYQEGYYVSYDDSTHFGVISFRKLEEGFRFKKSKKSRSRLLTTTDAKSFVVGDRRFLSKSFNTSWDKFERTPNLLTNSIVLNDPQLIDPDYLFFMEFIENGVIDVFAKSDIEIRVDFSGIPSFGADTEFYLEKEDKIGKINNSSHVMLPLKLFRTLKRFIDDDSVFLEKYESGVYRDRDWLTLVKDYNNKYRNLPSKKDTVVVYRTDKKQREEIVSISIDNESFALPINTLVKKEVDDITDFEMCVNGTCKRYAGSLITESYFELLHLKKDNHPRITYADTHEAAFYKTRIEYLMKKKAK